MTYDFYQYLPTQPLTGHNAPLFKRPEEFWIFGWLNTVTADVITTSNDYKPRRYELSGLVCSQLVQERHGP